MAARPIWNGHLKLSLVSCAVSLYSATTQSEKITFHMLNVGTGNRLRQQYVDEVTRDVIERDDRVRGYEVEDGSYVVVTEDEFDKLEIESTHAIEIDTFVEAVKIDRVYFDDSFFVAPDDEVGADAFAVIRDSMRSRKVVGIGRIVMYRRERPILIEPRGNGLLATTLRYNYEVKDDKPYLQPVGKRQASAEMVDLAGYIIDRKLGEFDPASFEDRYQNALADLIQAKQAGKAPPKPRAAPEPVKGGNLLEALLQSVQHEKSAPRRPVGKSSARAGRARSSRPSASARKAS